MFEHTLPLFLKSVNIEVTLKIRIFGVSKIDV